MKSTLLRKLHVVIMALLLLWTFVSLAAPAVKDTGIYIAIALGPLISYGIAVWLIGTLRRDVPRL
jgi:hypothetical protein